MYRCFVAQVELGLNRKWGIFHQNVFNYKVLLFVTNHSLGFQINRLSNIALGDRSQFI